VDLLPHVAPKTFLFLGRVLFSQPGLSRVVPPPRASERTRCAQENLLTEELWNKSSRSPRFSGDLAAIGTKMKCSCCNTHQLLPQHAFKLASFSTAKPATLESCHTCTVCDTALDESCHICAVPASVICTNTGWERW